MPVLKEVTHLNSLDLLSYDLDLWCETPIQEGLANQFQCHPYIRAEVGYRDLHTIGCENKGCRGEINNRVV